MDGTTAKLRLEAWVTQAGKVVKSRVYNCTTCIKNKAKPEGQVMGKLPDFRAQESPAFTFTTVDLFGPYLVKRAVNKRSRMKVWGAIFSCLASRAIYVDIVGAASTEAFLITYRRFQTVRGSPAIIYSRG